jgi:hypothetical protein
MKKGIFVSPTKEFDIFTTEYRNGSRMELVPQKWLQKGTLFLSNSR